MTSNSMAPIDQAARSRIEKSQTESLFIQAGAGSGKTTQIVRRIVVLVGSGVPISTIVAITFTEKAAADLRNRVRTKLAEAIGIAGDSTALFEQALDDLDGAPMGTIHSFARRLLAENPIEAGVPPGFEVRNELATQIDRTAQWQNQRQIIFASDELRPSFDLLVALGVKIGTFETMATQLDEYWDRVRPRSPEALSWAEGLSRVSTCGHTLVAILGQCKNPDTDHLAAAIYPVAAWLNRLDGMDGDDDVGLARLLSQMPVIGKRLGNKANWPDGPLEQARELALEFKALTTDAFLAICRPALDHVVDYFGEIAQRRAEARRLAGVLNFQDLLVFARDLMVSTEQTWAVIAARYRYVIVDEFQDTDVLQAELVCRLTATEFASDVAWDQLSLRPGALVTVGDPKQSIYRFRGADIDTYFRHRDRQPPITADPVVELTTNFRSTAPLLDWVNKTFQAVIEPQASIQPAFVPLDANPAITVQRELTGPTVAVIGDGVKSGTSAETREEEARDIAQSILQATGRIPGVDRWTAQHRLTDSGFEARPVMASDICILIPTRTSLPALESALRRADIEFVSEASSIVYSTMEVQALLMAARAVVNTADEAALVLALRSPLFGIGDDELFDWHADHGSWSVFDRSADSNPDSRVAAALIRLRSLVFQLPSLTPSDVLEELARTGLFFEKAGASEAGMRAWWRRVRYVIDQAEAWYQTTKGSLRDYLDWTAIQQEEKTRVREAISPETGDDAVRIMTIHMAKGLEYPVVIVGGAMSGPIANKPVVLWTEAGNYEVRLPCNTKDSFSIETAGYSHSFDVEKRAQHAEFRRVLYVACTRAESHLVFSQHVYKTSPEHSFGVVLAGVGAGGFGVANSLENYDQVPLRREGSGTARSIQITSVSQWDQWHQGLVATASARRSRSVTDFAHNSSLPGAADFFDSFGLAAPSAVPEEEKGFDPVLAAREEQPDDDLKDPKKKVVFRPLGEQRPNGKQAGVADSAVPVEGAAAVSPRLTAVSGPQFGNALHWVMEVSDLTPNDQLGVLAAKAAELFRVGDASAIEQSARAAMATEVIAYARTRPHWAEMPLAVMSGGVVVEGVADLVFEAEDQSLVVVDFKTDRVLEAGTLGSYWSQLASYAAILQRATGKSATRCVIVHAPAGAHTAHVIEHVVVFG